MDINVTPEMKQAGLDALWESCMKRSIGLPIGFEKPNKLKEMVADIYRVMHEACIASHVSTLIENTEKQTVERGDPKPDKYGNYWFSPMNKDGKRTAVYDFVAKPTPLYDVPCTPAMLDAGYTAYRNCGGVDFEGDLDALTAAFKAMFTTRICELAERINAQRKIDEAEAYKPDDHL